MKKVLLAMLALAMLLGMVTTAMAEGTPDDAKAMVEKAVALYQANGKEALLAEVNNPSGSLINDDIYVFIFDMEGNTLAHGANAKLVGKNMLKMKDADGKEFMRDFYKVPDSGGWVEYKWTHPTQKKIRDKVSWIMMKDGLLFGSGAYK